MGQFTQSAKLGEILLKDKLISEPQLNKALEAQKQAKKRINAFNLSTYLVENKIIEKKRLQDVEDKYQLNKRLGASLLSESIITQDQLNLALKEKKDHQFLGETLLKMGYVDRSQLYETLKEVVSVPSFESVLVKEGLVTKRLLDKIVVDNTLPPSLGEILIDQEAISIQKLFRALKKHHKRRPLGDMLVEAGLITQENLEDALIKQKFADAPLGKTLVTEGYITDMEFRMVLARQFALKYQIIDTEQLQKANVARLRQIVGARDAIRYRIVPLTFENKKLTLGVLNPFDLERLDAFDSIINFHLKISLLSEPDFQAAFEAIYNEAFDLEAYSESVSETGGDSMDLVFEGETEGTEFKSKYVGGAMVDNEAEKLVNLMISYALKFKASDIHFELGQKGMTVRYRVDGFLRELKDTDIQARLKVKASHIISRIKVMSQLDIAERRLPQDGAFRMSIADPEKGRVQIDFRVATCKGVHGENVVVRIMDSRQATVRLDELSHSMDVLSTFAGMLKNPSGMILVTGPTGSGKTSTLYAALNYLNQPGTKIVTAEDPVEFDLEGIMQTKAEPKIGLSFARLMRSFLRHDPDIVMVGEIRDAETAEIAIEAALTGHLVLSTMHTNDAVGAVSRLRDLGISNLQIASALKGVVAQRLVRRICDNCRVPYVPDHMEWSVAFPEEPVHLAFHQGEGCPMCGHSGFTGRLPVSEMLVFTKEVNRAIIEGKDLDSIYTEAKITGLRSMIDDGLDKLKFTTLAELYRVVPADVIERRRNEYGQLSARFDKFVLPEGCHLDYQMLLTRSRQGFSRERVRELFSHYRGLRKKLKEQTDHMKESSFVSFLEDSFKKLENGDKSAVREYRVSLLNKQKKAMIMVETTSTTNGASAYALTGSEK